MEKNNNEYSYLLEDTDSTVENELADNLMNRPKRKAGRKAKINTLSQEEYEQYLIEKKRKNCEQSLKYYYDNYKVIPEINKEKTKITADMKSYLKEYRDKNKEKIKIYQANKRLERKKALMEYKDKKKQEETQGI